MLIRSQALKRLWKLLHVSLEVQTKTDLVGVLRCLLPTLRLHGGWLAIYCSIGPSEMNTNLSFSLTHRTPSSAFFTLSILDQIFWCK